MRSRAGSGGFAGSVSGDSLELSGRHGFEVALRGALDRGAAGTLEVALPCLVLQSFEGAASTFGFSDSRFRMHLDIYTFIDCVEERDL